MCVCVSVAVRCGRLRVHKNCSSSIYKYFYGLSNDGACELRLSPCADWRRIAIAKSCLPDSEMMGSGEYSCAPVSRSIFIQQFNSTYTHNAHTHIYRYIYVYRSVYIHISSANNIIKHNPNFTNSTRIYRQPIYELHRMRNKIGIIEKVCALTIKREVSFQFNIFSFFSLSLGQ